LADIFVSYSRQNKARVAPLVRALEAEGWSVWWDPEITPGEEFDTLISRELDQARALVVVWTPDSVDSRWVRGEARDAADRGVLVPVRFDNARLPIDFRALHTTDLDDWAEDSSRPAFRSLCKALESKLGPAAKAKAALAADKRHAVGICVLPFANMSGDPEQEYFSDGISDDIAGIGFHCREFRGAVPRGERRPRQGARRGKACAQPDRESRGGPARSWPRHRPGCRHACVPR
jgi:adenylate cyclase